MNKYILKVILGILGLVVAGIGFAVVSLLCLLGLTLETGWLKYLIFLILISITYITLWVLTIRYLIEKRREMNGYYDDDEEDDETLDIEDED